MNGSKNREQWKAALSSGLPGTAAQLQMAPDYRGETGHSPDPVQAAVLALMYPLDGQTGLVLIKRNEYDGPHSGQVSFPGGAREPGDRSLSETAIRETREELGITGEIDILGQLTELHIPVSNFLVTPFAGITGQRPDFHPDSTEVQYLIETTLGNLLDPANCLKEKRFLHRQSLSVPYYRVYKEKIWGATAMILSEFLQLAARLQSHHR